MAHSKRPTKPDACPKCSSRKVASILYGLPRFDEELERSIDVGGIVLGGCCIFGEDPTWHCNTCRHQWGGEEEDGIEGDVR